MNNYQTKKIILFDGYCNLCSSTVQFIIKHDRSNTFQFASLQGKFGKQILQKLNLSGEQLSTFILIDGNKYHTQSTGALMVARNLSGLWPSLYIFILVPKFLRDSIYKWIAANRYRWFGKRDACWVPQLQYAARFID